MSIHHHVQPNHVQPNHCNESGQINERNQRMLRSGLSLRPLLAIVAIAITMVGAVSPASAGSWVYKELDKVRTGMYGLELYGNVQWWYDSDNSNNRYVTYGIQAIQSGRQYRAYCVGIQAMYYTEKTQSTVGGSVTGGWSLGPSASVSGSYSQTKLGGTTTDGFAWKCPASASTYVRNDGGGGQSFHPSVQGRVRYVAVRACLSDNPLGTNRWCTPWDVNQFGAS